MHTNRYYFVIERAQDIHTHIHTHMRVLTHTHIYIYIYIYIYDWFIIVWNMVKIICINWKVTADYLLPDYYFEEACYISNISWVLMYENIYIYICVCVCVCVCACLSAWVWICNSYTAKLNQHSSWYREILPKCFALVVTMLRSLNDSWLQIHS